MDEAFILSLFRHSMYFSRNLPSDDPEGDWIKPLAYSVDGEWIYSAEDLPHIEFPSVIHVSEEHLQLDKTILPYNLMRLESFQWLQKSFIRWSNDSRSENNYKWVDEIVNIFQQRLKRDFRQ